MKVNKINDDFSNLNLSDTQKLIDISLYGFLHMDSKNFRKLNKKRNLVKVQKFIQNYFSL